MNAPKRNANALKLPIYKTILIDNLVMIASMNNNARGEIK